MNRPNKLDYHRKVYGSYSTSSGEPNIEGVVFDIDKYTNDLELYSNELEEMNGNQRDTIVHFKAKCEELEKQLHHSYQRHLLEVVIPSLENRIKTLEKQLVYTENKLLDTEKALDNVCEQLENICSTETYCVSHCPLGKKGGCEYRCEKKEEWKKWSINNEN